VKRLAGILRRIADRLDVRPHFDLHAALEGLARDIETPEPPAPPELLTCDACRALVGLVVEPSWQRDRLRPHLLMAGHAARLTHVRTPTGGQLCQWHAAMFDHTASEIQ
jgi:hypothetical protein